MLKLTLLGPFQITLEGKPVPGCESTKSRALLAYLVEEHGQSHSRSMMAGLLWPETAEKAALNNLRQALFKLQHAIHDLETSPPFLVVDRESIALYPNNYCSVDTYDFRMLLDTATEQNRPAASSLHYLDQAASLYRGEFLNTLFNVDSPIFEDWILTRREFYRAQVLEALNLLVEASLSQGDYGRVKRYTRQQMEIDPCMEEAHCYLMQALALEGKRYEALAQYASCCSLLEKELNVGPSPATIQLFERIRDGSLSSDQTTWRKPVSLTRPQNMLLVTQPPRLHNLPRSLTSFIGREDEIAALMQLITRYDLVTLTGPGGVGKTRLALELARQLLGTFRDGVWLVDLAQVKHQYQILSMTFKILGLGEEQVQTSVEGLINRLKDRQILLIFDTCGHLLETCAEIVYSLIHACQELKILVTSRVKLDLDGEKVYRLPALSFPDLRRLPALENILEYPAIRLFADRAQAALPSFQITQSNLRQVVGMCQQLDGIPLAIELAAGRLDLLTVEQLAPRLTGSFQLLTSDESFASPRHQSIRESIHWGYQILSDEERLLLQRLSVFEGGFTLDAAESVCTREGIGSDEMWSLLTSLVDHSVVIFEGLPDKEKRFRLLNTVRQFAQEKLRQSGDEKRLGVNLFVYCLHLADTARPRLKTGERLIWLKKLDADQENLFRAIRWAIDDGNDILAGLQMVCWLDNWWSSRGFLEQGVHWLRGGLASWIDSSDQVSPLRVEALCLLAKHETNHDFAFSLVSQALSLAHELGLEDRLKSGLAYHTAGFLFRSWLQNPILAYAFTYEALRIYQGYYPTQSWEIGCLLEEESKAYLLLGNYPRATNLARKSWEVFQDIGDHWYSHPLSVLGTIALEQGNYCQARMHIGEALTQIAEGEDAGELGYLELLARLERKQGNYLEAIAHLREAILRSEHRYQYFYLISLLEELAFTEIEYSRTHNGSETEKRLRHATRLLGAAETGGLTDSLRILAFPKKNYEPMVAELRARSDSAKLNQAWKEGNAMQIGQAASYALEYPLAG
jgi:predicted ATPase/DNA-binding SARP family transcriptional activator